MCMLCMCMCMCMWAGHDIAAAPFAVAPIAATAVTAAAVTTAVKIAAAPIAAAAAPMTSDVCGECAQGAILRRSAPSVVHRTYLAARTYLVRTWHEVVGSAHRSLDLGLRWSLEASTETARTSKTSRLEPLQMIMTRRTWTGAMMRSTCVRTMFDMREDIGDQKRSRVRKAEPCGRGGLLGACRGEEPGGRLYIEARLIGPAYIYSRFAVVSSNKF
jgi:hypothetical protein